ncbi:MAG: helix-turn-helix transcriptional regulator [Sphingobium sp.]|uniref:helix-turn-helix domain-containing protein n=1 Tax=Sphingobium sp. TaxID=1912891 RepID=UPI003BAF7CDD
MDGVSHQDSMDSQPNDAPAPQSLLEWRKAKGLLQEEAGAMAGVSKVSWGNWEMGRKPPRAAHLDRLSRLTGLSHEQILRPLLTPHRAGPDMPGAPLAEKEDARASSAPFRKAG